MHPRPLEHDGLVDFCEARLYVNNAKLNWGIIGKIRNQMQHKARGPQKPHWCTNSSLLPRTLVVKLEQPLSLRWYQVLENCHDHHLTNAKPLVYPDRKKSMIRPRKRCYVLCDRPGNARRRCPAIRIEFRSMGSLRNVGYCAWHCIVLQAPLHRFPDMLGRERLALSDEIHEKYYTFCSWAFVIMICI